MLCYNFGMQKIDSSIGAAFARGLGAGFAGKSTYQKITRGKFPVESSSFDEEDNSYIDQWMPKRLGGGQEILKVGSARYTRVYAGGTVEKTELEKIGVSESDVITVLKESLVAAGPKTRFDKEYQKKDGDWKYVYTPNELDTIVGLISGKEVISYKNTPVFVHYFIISRVSE